MTSTVFTRGSAWRVAELHDVWGDNVTDEQVAALGKLVVERFHTLAQDTSVSWFPTTSEVIGDVDDDVTTEHLEEWREQALEEVWAAVVGESADADLCAEVADIFKEGSQMESIKLYVGSIVAGNSGQQNDTRRPVEFVGELVASHTEYGFGPGGGITDTRGVTEVLYRTDDDRLIVHVDDWSRWQGEPSTEQIHEVAEADLQIGGRFERLGAEAGYGRPLTLDEALSSLHSPSERANKPL